MQARKVLPLVLAAVSLTILAGCGSGPSSAGVPQGNFTNANLSGTYAFAFSGTNGGGFFTMAGSFQANGNGAITSGTIDINSPGTTAGVLTNLSLTGTYIVHADGRGAAALNPSGFNTINLNFVLLSSQHGALIRFDGNATGSGSLDMQTSSAFNLAALAGTFAFNVSGVDGGAQNPESSAGALSVDASGNLLANGVQDTNDNGTLSTNDPLTAASAAMSSPGLSNGRGTLAIASAAHPTRNFVFYVIDANHLRLIEVDSAPILAGDAFRQTSTAISGSFAFTVSGSSGGTPFAAGGIFDTDGAGNVLNSSVEDVNSGGTITTNVTISGAFTAVTNGRSTLSLNSGAANYAVYPSVSGLQFLRIDANPVASGTAFQQSGSFSNSTISGRYGANITGVIAPATEFDAIYQFTANGNGALTGAQDVNLGGALSANLALNGTAALASNGRASNVGKLNTAAGNLQVIYYAVNSSQILFIEVDNNAVAVGSFSQQQ
jgi:hypothetical protein